MGFLDSLLNWLRSLFFKQEMELSLVGLQNAGKTSLVNSIATGGYSEDMIPTVGFNMRKVTKGNVTIKLWDLGGQRRFRTMWERYCRGVSAIVYVVDAADRDSIPISRSELYELLTKPSLSGIPLLVLGNKIDKSEALSKQALVDQLGLESITDREVCQSQLVGRSEDSFIGVPVHSSKVGAVPVSSEGPSSILDVSAGAVVSISSAASMVGQGSKVSRDSVSPLVSFAQPIVSSVVSVDELDDRVGTGS
ncbi:hypothetical protein LWI29_036757 [Acer saccharum]|uniref:Uncharacterized protein n=1 Tax=Acer saccharum TaxID=4024 RepID=A0AA39W1Q6_ACESA|nr:hypothetical protein LWI29_036757 [Acer saccharum]